MPVILGTLAQLAAHWGADLPLLADPAAVHSTAYSATGWTLFGVSLLLPTLISGFTSVGDREQLLTVDGGRGRLALETAAFISHLLLPASTCLLCGVPCGLLCSLVLLKALAFVLAGGRRQLAELATTLLVLAGGLPALVLLLADRSLAFYALTWLLPALLAAKWHAEAALLDTAARRSTPAVLAALGTLRLLARAGALAVGIGLGAGWLIRLARRRCAANRPTD